MARTRTDTYYEDFEVGDIYEHHRGKTVTETDNVLLTNMVLNTAEAHFNEDAMTDTEFGERVVFGGISLSLVCGLASADITENAITEQSYDDIQFTAPVFHGDTLYAESEVLAKGNASDHEDGGTVTFRVRGYNQNDEQVLGVTKTVLLRRRSAGDEGET